MFSFDNFCNVNYLLCISEINWSQFFVVWILDSDVQSDLGDYLADSCIVGMRKEFSIQELRVK